MSSKTIFALAAIAALCVEANPLNFRNDPFWKTFKGKFKKTYTNEAEESMRYQIFLENMQKAAELNEEPGDAWYGMTPLSDKRKEEFLTSIIKTPMNLRHGITFMNRTIRDEDFPEHYDAREHQLVNPVVNQMQCGSCWAFASTATLAASYARKHKRLLRFSEQQSVECWRRDGCTGGNFGIVYDVSINQPLMLRDDYPYTGVYTGNCLWKKELGLLKVTGGEIHSGTTVPEMKEFLLRYGVGYVTYCADKSHGYVSGIMTGSHCYCGSNHAVAAIGWGKTSDDREYWILRNSWGESWGEHGYFRMEMGTNACWLEQGGITTAEVE